MDRRPASGVVPATPCPAAVARLLRVHGRCAHARGLPLAGARRGAADELSDVDAELGVRDDAVETVTEAVQAYLTQDAEAVDVLRQAFGTPDQPALRTFIQFAGGHGGVCRSTVGPERGLIFGTQAEYVTTPQPSTAAESGEEPE